MIKQVMNQVMDQFERVMNVAKSHKWMIVAGAAVVVALVWLLGGDEAAMWAAVVPGVTGGAHVTGEPLTLTKADEASPTLLRNAIDERIVKIRPMATPIDQISRYGGARQVNAMTVDYYSVDTLPGSVNLVEKYDMTSGKLSENEVATLKIDQSGIVAATDTLLVMNDEEDVDADVNERVMLYVIDAPSDGTIKVMAINGPTTGEYHRVPTMKDGTRLMRMGRAAGELDVMTSQFQALPKVSSNYCQIFKSQVEQSTLQKMANKTIGWNFNDQEESAIIDMRMSMEKSFIFGVGGKVYDVTKGSDVYFTRGIWHQAGGDFEYPRGGFSSDTLVELSRAAFTGQGSSSKKVLIGGSKLIEQLSKLEHTKVMGATETSTCWGLDLHEIDTKFGKLYVMLSETFDMCGMNEYGMVIDPEYITKYCHQPFHTKRLDLRSAGVRNTDAVVITEASCLVLRYPDAHIRIKPAKN